MIDEFKEMYREYRKTFEGNSSQLIDDYVECVSSFMSGNGVDSLIKYRNICLEEIEKADENNEDREERLVRWFYGNLRSRIFSEVIERMPVIRKELLKGNHEDLTLEESAFKLGEYLMLYRG